MPCCSNPACTDLCGRWGAISIPTATLNVGILSWPDCDAEVAEGVGHGWGVRRQPQRVQNFGYRARKSMPAIAQVVFQCRRLLTIRLRGPMFRLREESLVRKR